MSDERTTPYRRSGDPIRGLRVEVLEGLSGGETVALDGAGFLADNAVVAIKEPAKVSGGGTPPPAKQ